MLIIVLILIWAIWDAAIDYRYRKKGGMKSTRRTKTWFGIVSVLPVLIIVRAFTVSGEAAAHTVELFIPLLFAVWEFGRWRVRRLNPLPQKST
jgi:hypothetical protein